MAEQSGSGDLKTQRVMAKELNLFQLPPLNSSIEKRQWVEHQPTFQGGKTYEFSISGTGNQYTDLSKTYLKTKVRIKKPNNGGIFVQDEKTSTALPIDNVLHSLWNDVHVKFNNTLVSTANTNYAYKAYIEQIMKFNSMAKEKQLSLVGFTSDQGNFDQTDPDEPPYSYGLKQRFKWFKKIYTKYLPNVEENETTDENEVWEDPSCVEFMGPLMADICQQNRLIINGVNIDIKLTPNKDNFRLLTFPDKVEAEIELVETKLMVCRVTVANETFLAIENTLSNVPVVYPHARTDVRIFNIPAGSYSATYEDLFQGEVPSKTIVGMVDAKALSGDFHLNPFRFSSFNVEYMGFYVDDESVPRQPYQFNVKDCGYIDGLQSLYEVAGKWNENTDLHITRDSYRQGLFLVGFDIDGSTSPNLTSYVGKVKAGRTRFNIKFHKALAKPIGLIVYAAFQEVAQIDASRTASLREKDKNVSQRRGEY